MGFTISGGLTFSGGFTGTTPVVPVYWVTGLYFSSGYSTGHGTAVDADGNIYMSGVSQAGNGTFLAKFNSSGTLQWHKITPGSPGGVVIDGSGNIAHCIRYGDSLSITRFDSSGNAISSSAAPYITTTFGGYPGYNAGSITKDSSDNIYIYGDAGTTDGQVEIRVAKYNSSYTLQWIRSITVPVISGVGKIRTYNQYQQGCQGLVVSSTGDVYVVGSTNYNNPSSSAGFWYRGFIIKLNSSGSSVWQNYFDTAQNFVTNEFSGVKIDSSGNIYVVSYGNGNGQARAASLYTMSVIVKYNSSGNILWQRAVSDLFGAVSVEFDANDNVYIAGWISSDPYGVVLIKYNSSGTVQWQRRFRGNYTGNGANGFAAVKITSVNATSISLSFALRTTSSPSVNYDAALIKYPLDGSLTGTYTLGTSTITIAAGSLTTATPTMSGVATGDFTVASGSGSGTQSVTVSTSTLGQLLTVLS